MSVALESFGMIGDGGTVALVSHHGSIDWLCLPRFDSPACCASLVGTPDNGHWSIAPEAPVLRSEQRYRPDTLVLETDMTTAGGAIRLTDFMPIREHDPLVIRIVSGLSGRVASCMKAALRLDYGNMPPWIAQSADTFVMRVGPDEVMLHGAAGAEHRDGVVRLRFEIAQGESRAFILRHRYFDANAGAPGALPDPQEALEATCAHWQQWIGRMAIETDFPDTMRRSLLTLNALIHRPTGGLVAAPTTSLPEKPGGELNWDYRYCWLRDASFTVSALIDSGFRDEAQAWRDWILRAVAGAPEKMGIVYRVDGSRRLDESTLPWLPGYRFAQPVRIGNAAAGQFQLDVYGELMNTLRLCESAGMERSKQMRHLERAIAEHVAKVWTQPDQGLWESRGQPRHYTYSKVMAWVAIDRYLKGADKHRLEPADRERLEALRSHIHGVICKESFDQGFGSFTSYFGGQEVDASLLLLPKLGFLSASDERMARTIETIEKRLMVDGLVMRHRSTSPVPEGAFLACTFWLAECQSLQGRRDDARASVERALMVASPLGLLSEEYDPVGQRLSGNFPQALSHIALVNALLLLSKRA